MHTTLLSLRVCCKYMCMYVHESLILKLTGKHCNLLHRKEEERGKELTSVWLIAVTTLSHCVQNHVMLLSKLEVTFLLEGGDAVLMSSLCWTCWASGTVPISSEGLGTTGKLMATQNPITALLCTVPWKNKAAVTHPGQFQSKFLLDH